jgi:TfoX/Sxy family transcriptional regulator of competence genes
MAFDEDLAARVRDRLARRKNIEEKKMFGGLAFLLNGNLLVGVRKDSLLVRLGEEQGERALLEPHVRPFEMRGKPMKGWLVVAVEGVEDDDRLADWLDRATQFVHTLPAK